MGARKKLILGGLFAFVAGCATTMNYESMNYERNLQSWMGHDINEKMEPRPLPYCPNSFGRDGFEPRWFERDQDNDCIPELADPNPTKHFNDKRR